MAIESIREAVGAAIERASHATGVDFGFLMRTARRESGYNAAAQAQGSSAAGLFQFVEQTWLGALKKHGAKHGYSAFADLIQASGDGRLAVAGGDARKAVMALRMDPKASSLMAGELASDNAAYLRGRVGREPTSGELYAAHFLGPKGSADLIEARQSRPSAAAAALFPDAAAANPSIFYRDGRPASVADIYANLTQGQTGAAIEAAQAPASFLHYDTASRLARLEQERQITDMLLGIGQDASGQGQGLGLGLGQSRGSGGSAASLTSSLFSSEMLSLLSEARQSGRKS
jgi:hypothetical protein